MNGRDRRPQAEWPIDPDKPEPKPIAKTKGRNRDLAPILLAFGGLLLLLVLIWLFTGNRNSDQDKLTGAGTSAASADPEKMCSSTSTYDLIKRDLFRRAAQLRGSDQAAFDKLSAHSTIRMENPVMESETDNGGVNCAGSLSLDLPPGVAVVGGRRTLSADVDYSVRPAADDSGRVILLRNADAIVAPLATLARDGQQAKPAAPPIPDETSAGGPTADNKGPDPAPEPREPSPTATANPSFNCANARTRGEIAVCSDPALASLDRRMASQFNGAMGDATAEQRALLERTRSRFLGYRDSCRNDSCIADAYRGRMREIGDIMEGRWQPR